MKKLTYLISFLNLSGFFLVLAITALTFGLQNSTQLTYPTKAITIVLMIIALIINSEKIKLNNKYFIAYLIFLIFYINKLIIEALNPNPNLLNSVSMISLYVFAHSFLPFVFFLLIVNRNDFQIIFKALFASSLLFNIVVYFMYGDLLMEGVGRLGGYQTRKLVDEATLSPLVLAYNSTITIVLSLFALLSKKLTKYKKVFYSFAIVVALPGFLLGSSRGAVIGLIFSFLIYLLFSNQTSKLRLVILAVILLVLIISGAILYQSTVLDRFTSLFEVDLDQNLRVIIYKTTFMQFVESPIIGGSIQNDTVNHFPHNIYLEALTATGIFGFLALFYLTYHAFKNAIYIFKKEPSVSWIGVLFIVYFVHSLFNATIYGAVGFWMFLALLLSIKRVTYESYH